MNNLTQLRNATEAARDRLATEKSLWLEADAANQRAHQALQLERYGKPDPDAPTEIIIRTPDGLRTGGPRAAQGFKPAPTKLEIAADEAKQALSAAESRRVYAQVALNNAEAALLAVENKILNRWRDLRALAIRQAQREDFSAEHIAAMIADLRQATPPSEHQRRNQMFTPSALVNSVLHDRSIEDDLNTPINQLHGDAFDYDTKRAEILAVHESQPLEAA